MTKQLIKHFIEGFLSTFTFNAAKLQEVRNCDIDEYFANTNNYLNSSFEKLKGKRK